MLELTSKDCEEILSKSLNVARRKFQIKTIKVEKIKGFKGFLGEYFQLKIEYLRKKEIGEKLFFLKSISITNEKQKDFLEESGIFQKEVELYSSLIPKLLRKSFGKDNENWCPNCFLVKKNLLVFEDLKVQNYQNLPFEIDFQPCHIQELLKTMARFHASSIRYQEKDIKKFKTVGDEFKNILFETSFSPDVPWCIAGFKAITAIAMEKTRYSQNNAMKKILEETLSTKLYKIFDLMENPDPQFAGIKVFSHRDIWRNNVMFRFEEDLNGNFNYNDPKNCILLDFQTARFLPLCMDVMHAIVVNTRRAHHQNMINNYLQYYYEMLRNELQLEKIDLSKKYPWTEFLESCKHFTLLPLVINCISTHLTLIPPDFMQHLNEVDCEKFYKFCNVGRSEIILDRIDKDPYYRDCVVESVEELIEYLYLDYELVKC